MHIMSDVYNEKKGYVQKSIKAKGTFHVNLFMYYSSNSTKKLDKLGQLSNYILFVDSYLKVPKLYVMDSSTTEEVMDKLDIFQYRFGKIDEFVWWDLEGT